MGGRPVQRLHLGRRGALCPPELLLGQQARSGDNLRKLDALRVDGRGGRRRLRRRGAPTQDGQQGGAGADLPSRLP
eukprot:5653386-Alexandrium_andersonii.AAC.1